jgi:hypothetical protein
MTQIAIVDNAASVPENISLISGHDNFYRNRQYTCYAFRINF